MKPVVVFPDPVQVTIEYLRTVMPGVKVYTKVPESNDGTLEFVQVRRIGGARKSLILDRPRIDIRCWSDSEDRAEEFMRTVRAWALAMAGRRGETTVSSVSEVGGPQWLPDSVSGQPRYAFAVEFSCRGTEMR